MRTNPQTFTSSLVIPKNDIKPVKAPNSKVNDNSGKQMLVSCISVVPLAYETSKQQIRINYIRGIIQNKIQDPRYAHLNRLPQVQLQPNNSYGSNNMNSSKNPFIKSNNAFNTQPSSTVPQISGNFNQNVGNLNQNNIGKAGNIFSQANNNLGSPNYKSPFIPSQTLNNNIQNNYKNMFNQSPGLFKQTSFQAGNNPNSLNMSTNYSTLNNNQTSSNPLFSNNNQNNPTGIMNNPTGPGAFSAASTSGSNFSNPGVTNLNPFPNNMNQNPINNAPSFGAFNQSNPQTNVLGNTFQNASSPNFQQTAFNSQQPTLGGGFGPKPALSSNTFNLNPNVNPNQPLNTNQAGSIINPLVNPQPIQPIQAQVQQNPNQQENLKLDRNIKQLLESKPNLWNILSLDPNYKYGYNEQGRTYVKSVLQRIIDENILSQQALSKVIIQIYKKLYGAQNFEKYLQNSKKQKDNLNKDRQYRQFRIDQILSKQYQAKFTQSVFPKDFNNLSEDFYRSNKRKSSKFFDVKFTKKHDQLDFHENQRKYFKVIRPDKQRQLKVKFVQIKVKQSKPVQQDQNPYKKQQLENIKENINQIRRDHRKQIMPEAQELPVIQGFTISPTMQTLSKYTKYELLSVPKVIISNQWGSIKFKAPISLLKKNLKQGIIINQKSVQIIDEEWKIRQAQITFNKFANFKRLQQFEQDQLQQKIVNWCQKQKFQLIKVDRQRGEVVIEI